MKLASVLLVVAMNVASLRSEQFLLEDNLPPSARKTSAGIRTRGLESDYDRQSWLDAVDAGTLARLLPAEASSQLTRRKPQFHVDQDDDSGPPDRVIGDFELSSLNNEDIKPITQLDETESLLFSRYLLQLLLQQPYRTSQDEDRPIETPAILVSRDPLPPISDLESSSGINQLGSPVKRSRIYRPYPWKRQNRTSSYRNYEPYNPCHLQPKEVYNLLLALHDARQGKKPKVIKFCNRTRPATTIFTNIRFLG